MNNNKNTIKINTNNNFTTKIRLGILAASVITILMISPLSVIQSAYATDAPKITALIADGAISYEGGMYQDGEYSVGDTITIEFDSDTNMPGAELEMITKGNIMDLFTFTEFLGQAYRGEWLAPDTFRILITSINNPQGFEMPVIGSTTVIPSGIIPILSADETSLPSSAKSPALSGDFGWEASSLDWFIGALDAIYYNIGNVGIGTSTPNSKLQVSGGYIQLDVSSGMPPAADCNSTDDVGRMKVDDSTTDLYICTSSGWVTK